jgi:hypothetical protein
LEAELIHWNFELSGIVLEHSGEEGLREEEATEPECIWNSSTHPLSKESASFLQVTHIVGQRL